MPLVRVAVAFILFALPPARCYLDIREFDERCLALHKVTNYLVERPHQMNVDGLFGITLAEANLMAALSHPNSKFLHPRHSSLLSCILGCLSGARKQMKITVNPENREVALMNVMLNEPEQWARPIVWKSGALGKRPEPTAGLNRTLAERLIYRGSPRERESDLCIGQLARGALENECVVSDYCARMLTRKDQAAGYPLAHRLLYVQTARALACRETRGVSFFDLIHTFCGKIRKNLVDLEAAGFPGVSRDLVIEQTLLCGMEGFVDFANDHYAKVIRSWAHPAGCYSSRGFFNVENNFGNPRRSASSMDFGCENHASGLAAAVLSLLVRESLENSFSP